MTIKKDSFQEYKPITTSIIIYKDKWLMLALFDTIPYWSNYQGHICYACANIEEEPIFC
jgi:hypothetical protein